MAVSATFVSVGNHGGGTALFMTFHAGKDGGVPIAINCLGGQTNYRPKFVQINAEGCIYPITFQYISTAGLGLKISVDPMNRSNKVIELPDFPLASVQINFNGVDVADGNKALLTFYDCEIGLSDYSADTSAISQFFNVTELSTWGPSVVIPNVYTQAQFIYASAANPTSSAIQYAVSFDGSDGLTLPIWEVGLQPGASQNATIFSGGATSTLSIIAVICAQNREVIIGPPAGSRLTICIGVRNAPSN